MKVIHMMTDSSRCVEQCMHLRTLSLVLACLCGLGTGCEKSGGKEQSAAAVRGIAGRVTLRGAPPPEKPITAGVDPACAQLQTNALTTRHYVVGTNGGLADTVVYVKEGLSGATFPASVDEPIISFNRCQIFPYVSAVRTGQRVELRNEKDNVLHNIHGVARANREFNLAMPTRGQTTSRTFDAPEMFIRLKCDVHPWEFAHVCVFDHPFFAITDANGNFELPLGLPDGKYVIEARHLKSGAINTAVVIVGGKTRFLDLGFDAPPSR